MFIKSKADEYQRCAALNDDAIPPCAPEERWERPPKFAVMKSGAKRAARLFDRQDDAKLFAEAKGEGHRVEHRKGESVKCSSYCLCKRFCNFYRDFVASGSHATDCEQAVA
jgi:hypothetical protein